MMVWEIVWLLAREHVLKTGPTPGASSRKGCPGTGQARAGTDGIIRWIRGLRPPPCRVSQGRV
jgi:hypothetical protein